MTDPIQILEEYLRSETFTGWDGVNLRTWMGGNYFWTPQAPPGFTNGTKTILFAEETGNSHITDANRECFALFRCYGASALFSEAREVREALHNYLHNARGKVTASGVLQLAEETNRFQGPPDPDTNWPVAIARYRIITAT